MENEFTFKVEGRVVGSARPRVTRNGTFIPKKTRDYRARIRGAFIESGGMRRSGPISVSVSVFRELPKSRPKSVTSEPDTFKPDVDNIGKNVLDALNGIAWDDDSQVVELVVRKYPRRREPERLEVSISGA